eukprot:4425_1
MNWLALFILLHLIGNGHAQLNCHLPLDLVYVIDESGSISGEWDQVIMFLQAISNQLDVDSGSVQIAVVKFASVATIAFHLNTYTTNLEINGALAALTNNGGGSYLTAGLNAALMVVNAASRPGVLKMAMLITDGIVSTTGIGNVLNALEAAGVTIITIGIGNDERAINLLSVIASDPSLAFTYTDYNSLTVPTIMNTIQEFIACPPTSSPSLSPSASPTQSPS